MSIEDPKKDHLLNSKKEILGLIPARGGSKAIPQKNLAFIAGRPLLAYTCDAALASKQITRTVLSTDNQAIVAAGRHCGVEAPFMRPANLAQDETPMLDVLRHTLKTLQESESYWPDVIVLLQPTSPLRRAEHIDAAVDLLIKTGADSVVSVVEVPHQYNPVSLMHLEAGKLVSFSKESPILRRQDKPILYARNGPAILVIQRNVLFERNSLYGEDCRPLIMDSQDSIDIDNPFDLEWAEFLLSRRGTTKLNDYNNL